MEGVIDKAIRLRQRTNPSLPARISAALLPWEGIKKSSKQL